MNPEIKKLKDQVAEEKKIFKEIQNLSRDSSFTPNPQEKRMIDSQINNLKLKLKETNKELEKALREIKLTAPLKSNKNSSENSKEDLKSKIKPVKLSSSLTKKLENLEKETIKRLKKKEKNIQEQKEKKPSLYVNIANKIFGKTSETLREQSLFRTIKRDLIKANLLFMPKSYISVILFTTLLSLIFSFLLFTILLIFNISLIFPFISLVDKNIGARFLEIFWIPIVIPLSTALLLYFYPSMEKKSASNKINQELPFATIHMAAISGSLIEPSKIFSIIISTKEYPNLEKQFIKLMNEINIFGQDLVTALRAVAFNSPSKKFADLLNGIATTITSGGDLPEFFDKRSKTLLFDYRLEREKYTKTAETFMDIYISVVIAAPMILMLLLMMMQISGLGISLSTGAITLIMILGVILINIAFIVFLQAKQPEN